MDIIVRKAAAGDGKRIVDSFKKTFDSRYKNFNKYLCIERLHSKEHISTIDRKLTEHPNVYLAIIALNKRDTVVGFSSVRRSAFFNTAHRAECSWFVDMKYAHKGIATRIVKMLIDECKKIDIKRLEAEVVVENVISINFAKKLGFEIEGRRKKALLIGKRYHDTYLMSKLL